MILSFRMADSNGTPSVPRFRIVQGRGLGERASSQSQPPPSAPHSTPSPNPMMQQQPLSQMSTPSMHSSVQIQQTMGTPQQMSHVGPGPNGPSPPSSNGPVPNINNQSSGSGQPVGEERDQVVAKCIRFFKTLITLSQQPDQSRPGQPNTAVRVRELVSNVIYGSLAAEDFTRMLQEALRSQAQPHLLPFLQKTLPHLRNAIQNGEVTIDGISPPPGFQAQIPMHRQPQLSEHSEIPPGTPERVVMIAQPGRSSLPLNSSDNGSGSRQVMAPASSQSGMGQPQHSGPSPGPVMSQAQVFVSQGPPHLQQTHHTAAVPQQVAMNQHPIPISQSAGNLMNMNVKQEISEREQSTSMDVEQPPQQEDETIQVRQLQENVFTAAILRPEDIMTKITRRMHEACYVEEEVLTLICDATENRLRSLLAELIVLAEHRIDPLRLNPNYVVVDDTRRQVKFLEDLDRMQEEQRKNRDKEQLIKMSKSKGTAKDTIERAKEMQRADAEAKRNRDANAAAIAALSGGNAVKPKWDQVGPGGTATVIRPKTIRVNIRDLQALVTNDPLCLRSQIAHKLALGGGSSELS